MQTNAQCSQNKVVMVGGADDTIFFAHFAPFFILLRLFQSVCRTLGLFFALFFATSENQGFMLVSGLMSFSHQEASAIYTHANTAEPSPCGHPIQQPTLFHGLRSVYT